jgi:di/tricarboxylate transporter
MRRQTVTLLGLSVVLVVALYFLFSLFLENTTIPYAYEIAAAFMGALVTVVIPMAPLNRQSELETPRSLVSQRHLGHWAALGGRMLRPQSRP